MNKSTKLCLALAAFSSLCLGQDALGFPMKRLSEIQSEKERCAFIIALADAGKLRAGQPWSKIEPFFDLGNVTNEIDSNRTRVFVSLQERKLTPKPPTIHGRPAVSAYTGWYVIIELDAVNQIRSFYLSNSHK